MTATDITIPETFLIGYGGLRWISVVLGLLHGR